MQAVIHIPQPCSENWDAMQPGLHGRHCERCTHEVIDFTRWELQDIAKYLEARKGQHTCGRFLTRQLNQPFDLSAFTPHVIWWQTSSFRKVAALIIVCFAWATTSCSNHHTQGEPEKLQRPVGIIEEPATVTPSPEDTVMTPPNNTTVRHKKVKAAGGISPSGSETTMGAPVMEAPQERRPVHIDTPGFQPVIGPPEKDIKQE